MREAEHHVAFDVRKRVLFFEHAEYEVHVVKEKMRADGHPSRWHWEAVGAHDERPKAVSPVSGWATEEEAEAAAREFFEDLGVSVKEIV